MRPSLVIPVLLALVPCTSRAQDPQELKERVEKLENRIAELEQLTFENSEKIGSRAMVQSYSSESLDFGGQLTSLVT